ncbi:MAG: hypothetical protein HYX20_03325 [Candidatus Yanofskybacteria bacterium]|nr:hypothetical protein [Candidatus Yanofskybacteria bacterium]
MSKTMTYGDAAGTLKVAVAIATAMLLVVGLVYFLGVQNTFAVAPSDFGLKEGDVVSAAGSDDPDVYIVNEMGFKRLFLNPAIFGFYGHLGGFAAVKNVSPATRDAFGTSGLFRNCETNDEKVYGVETTGEDTGMLHWVNTSGSQAVADDPNFFKKVFCINSNEFNWYNKGSNYTSVSQVPSYARVPGATTTPVATGPLSVSLAPSNPPAQTITINSYGMTVMALRFTGSGTVNELTLKRGGAGAVGDYDNLYVYDGTRRLTGGRSPSSSDGTVSFISLGVAVNGTKDLQIVADHSGVAGNVNNWTLTNVVASGTVSGFPVTSNNFQISGSNSGTLTVTKSGSVSNPKVGQKNAILSEFKVETATEATVLKRLQLLNGGSVKSADITNLRLEVSGVKVADGVMTGDGYAVLDFGSGHKITKGDNKIFKLIGDVSSKKDETIKFYIEYASDIFGIGDQYGQGMKATITDFDTSASTESHNLTLEGGVLTITFNGPSATNVSTTTSDTVLARYTFAAASNIEVKKLGLVLCWDDDGDGFNNAANTTNGIGDLEDVKITDEDTGQVVVGPADGSAFTTSEATGCPASANGASKIFTDTFDLLAGKPRNFKVTADIKTANTGGTQLTATDILKVVLDGYGEADLATTAGDIGVMKYSGTSTAVDDSDISPNTDLSGNNMTLQASSLTLGLSSSPTSTTYVKGTKDVNVVAFTLAASLASAIKVTDVTLTGYVDDSGGNYDVGVASGSDGSLSVGNLVSAVKIYDGDAGTLISDTPLSNNLNNTTGTIKFNNLSWTIPAGQTKRLLVKADLSSNATSASGNDFFTFDINTTSDITGIDDRSTTVNAGNQDPNGATTPTVETTVSNAGTIAVALAPANPIAEAKYWGQADTEFLRIRIRATNEAFQIERLNFWNISGDTAADVTNNIDTVKLTYTNKAGSTLTSTGTLNTDTRPSVSFGFTGDNRPYVPKDSSADIIVKTNLKTKAQGATSEVNFALDFSGGAANEFRAVGEGSGTVIEGNTTGSTIDDLSGNNMYVYRVFPKIEQLTLAASEPLGTKDTLKFKITAMGLADAKILFDDPTSASLKFEIVASGGADQTMWHYLYDYDTGELLASIQDTLGSAQTTPTLNASVSFTDWEKDLEIQGGQSKSFRVETAFQNFLDKSDYYQLILRDDASVIKYVDGARTGEDQEITNAAGVFKLLPMNGPIFVKQ